MGALLISVVSWWYLQTVPRFEFIKNTGHLYHVRKETTIYYGKLDEYGEFILDPKRRPTLRGGAPGQPGLPLSIRGLPLFRALGESNQAYEYRSGLLIPGQVFWNKFVPDDGGIVMAFSQYDYTKDPRFIYNLPGKFEYFPKPDLKKRALEGRNVRKDEDDMARLTKARFSLAVLLDEGYAFVKDTSTLYHLRQGNFVYYGHLDEDGEFVFDPKRFAIPIEPGQGLEGKPLVAARGPISEVYEFRSSRLIPGKIVDSRFVPERGGVVTSFDKYQHGKDPRIIYNLPGRFERVSKKQ